MAKGIVQVPISELAKLLKLPDHYTSEFASYDTIREVLTIVVASPDIPEKKEEYPMSGYLPTVKPYYKTRYTEYGDIVSLNEVSIR